MLSLSSAGSYGIGISIGYFVIDLGTNIITGNSIGDYINNGISDKFNISDGIILDLEPAFDYTREKWNEVTEWWDNINIPDLMY